MYSCDNHAIVAEHSYNKYAIIAAYSCDKYARLLTALPNYGIIMTAARSFRAGSRVCAEVKDMLERKVEKQLSQWKGRADRKCLLVKGARQVGKTFSIDKFCRENYKHYIYINFDVNAEYVSIFEGALDSGTIIKNLSLLFGNVRIVPGETVVFLDEIQNCPRARTALKFLAIDKPFDVIASGSLLGIRYKEVPSFPVGYVNHLEMHSLDFEEFCWANGITKEAMGYLRSYYDNKETVPAAVHGRMLRLFREYIAVGGMPAVVNVFLQTHHFGDVLETQRGIVEDYFDDIAKYAAGNDKAKARECFRAVPRNLAKANKKFQYSIVEKGGSARKYGGSLMWLFDAGIINYCYNLSVPELPLEGNSKNDDFKVYMRDTGLLVSMLEDGSQKDIISGNLGIYKGAIYENIIADVLTKTGKKLYYFCVPSQIEVDFFIRQGGHAIAVEVKSSENTKSKSMKSIISNYGVHGGIKLSTKNIGVYEKTTNLPLYMAMFM